MRAPVVGGGVGGVLLHLGPAAGVEARLLHVVLQAAYDLRVPVLLVLGRRCAHHTPSASAARPSHCRAAMPQRRMVRPRTTLPQHACSQRYHADAAMPAGDALRSAGAGGHGRPGTGGGVLQRRAVAAGAVAPCRSAACRPRRPSSWGTGSRCSRPCAPPGRTASPCTRSSAPAACASPKSALAQSHCFPRATQQPGRAVRMHERGAAGRGPAR